MLQIRTLFYDLQYLPSVEDLVSCGRVRVCAASNRENASNPNPVLRFLQSTVLLPSECRGSCYEWHNKVVRVVCAAFNLENASNPNLTVFFFDLRANTHSHTRLLYRTVQLCEPHRMVIPFENPILGPLIGATVPPLGELPLGLSIGTDTANSH
jgi:hypothetical protein